MASPDAVLSVPNFAQLVQLVEPLMKKTCDAIQPGALKKTHTHVCRAYTASQKTVQNCFCHKFVKCLPNLIIFGTQIAQRIGLREVHSFSTSPN